MATTLDPVFVDEHTVPESDQVSLSAPEGDLPAPEVSLSGPGPVPLQVPTNLAEQRAKKTQEGVGHLLQKDTNTIRQEIQDGRDSILRSEAASKINYNNTITKQRKLIELANQKGGPLDEEEVARIMDPFNPRNRPVDPDSVVEKQYGHAYIKTIQEAIDIVKNNPVADAQQEIPKQAEETFLKGSVLAAKMEYAKRIREDMELQIHNQSWIGWGADQAKSLVQLYPEFKMRGLNADVGQISGGILLGGNLQEQADALFALPFDEFSKRLKSITDTLAKDNPSLAHRFAGYVEGLPSTDRILDNTFSFLAVPEIAGVGKAFLGIGRKISLYNRTNKATRDYLKAADRVGTDPGGRAEAAGNLDTAAEVKSTDLVLKDINGSADPIKFATDDSLLTFLNQDKDKIGTDRGSLANQLVVMIQDAYDASGRTLLEKIANVAKLNRIPMAVATQNAVRIIKDAIKEYYPGIRNAILDVSNPLYESKSNTFWHEITFGNIGGRLFSNPETAANFARMHGFADIKIIEGHGAITPAQTEAMLERSAFLKNQIADWEQTIQRRRGEMKNTSLSAEDRAKAKEQAEGIKDFVIKAEREATDIELKIKGKNTYNRVQQLEGEAGQMLSANKDLRASLKKETKPEVKAHLEASIRFGEEQIKGKAQEIRALKEGRAEIFSPDTVEQHGVGFKIVIRRPLTETDKAVRDLMIRDASGKLIPEAISTSSQTGLKSLMNGLIGKARGADDTLALNESVARKLATYPQNLYKEWAQQEAKYIKQIASGVIREDPVTGEKIPYWKAKPTALWNKVTLNTRQTYNEFSRVLDYARDAKDPITGKPGYFFETPGQLEQHYLKYFDRQPSFAEHQAYFAFVRLVEGDRIFREIAEFRNRARLGTEQFSISARGPDGKQAKSTFFDGIPMKHFPGGDDVLMVMGKKLGDEKLFNLGGNAISPTQLAEWKKAVEQGRLRVIKVYAPEHKPLRDYSEVAANEHVRYILTDTAESKPIEFNHVNRRGGGHFEYDSENFLKQAKMYHQNETGIKGRYRSVYTGDTTVMPLLNRIIGKDIANKLHEVQRLLREGDTEGAKRWTQAHLPIEWDELHSMFKPGRDTEGRQTRPALDLHEPFVVVPRGKSILDMDKGLEGRHGKGTFKDGTKSGSDNLRFQVAFNTERDSSGLRGIEDIGTQGNPLYKYSADKGLVDPITTMERSLNRIMNSVVMDDYKIYAVEHWLREAEGHLKADQSEIYASPFWHFQQANDKSAFKGGTPPEVVRNLLSNRYKINQFVGVPNSTQTAIHSATQWLVDAAYTRFGPEDSRTLTQKAITIVPEWMLHRVTDPITFMRSATFHEKLGFWNPAQLLVQMQTFATTLSVSPFHGTAGTYAAFLHQWGRLNPNMINALDNMAGKLNVFGQSKWRPGEFKEANEWLSRVGFEKVAGEYTNLNTALKTDFIGNDFKSFLNAGTFFFREGEKSTRLGGWYTAFREFREAHPTGAISRDDIGKILQRADLLTVNMSRASNSMLHTGVLSLTTQFLSYQLRLAELFMGTRLGATTAERNMARLRMLTFYLALYGAPSAIGLTGLPLANAIREEAMQRGYSVGENWIKTAVDIGLPAAAISLATGNTYNIGNRLGSPGFTQLGDALKADKPWWQMLAGVSGTVLLNTLTATDPWWKAMGSMLSINNKDKAFPLKLDDFVGLFKEISSVNQGWKLIAAINTGKWMSKNEGYVGDVTKANAAFMAVLGFNPQEQDDSYLRSEIKKSEVAFQKQTLKEFIVDFRRGEQAMKDGNPQQAVDFKTRAFTRLELAGFPQDKKGTAIALAMKGYESLVDSSQWSFAFKNVPESRNTFLGVPTPFTTQSNMPDTRREQFRTQEQIERKNR